MGWRVEIILINNKTSWGKGMGWNRRAVCEWMDGYGWMDGDMDGDGDGDM